MPKKSRQHTAGKAWGDKKKIEVVAAYLALGNSTLVEATTGVAAQTIKHWRMQEWWKEFEDAIRSEEDQKLDKNLTKIVDASLGAIQDRVDNGDFVYNQKTGEITRKPVNLKDAVKAADVMIDKRNLLRGKPTRRTETTNDDRLKKLALQFEEFVKFKKTRLIEGSVVEVVDTPVLETGASSHEGSNPFAPTITNE
jgi:hypothetical protein